MTSKVEKSNEVEAPLQPRQMLPQPVRPTAVHRYQLVDAIAVDKAAIEHRNLGLFEWKKLAVEIDGHERPFAAENGGRII